MPGEGRRSIRLEYHSVSDILEGCGQHNPLRVGSIEIPP